jgi:hypothetical protein
MEQQTGEASVTVVVDEDQFQINDRRQQHRNVFTERCRLSLIREPDEASMLSWWPGTKPFRGELR